MALNKTFTSSYLYDIAFFLTLGATIASRTGTYPSIYYTLNVAQWMLWYQKIGWVNYRKFAKARAGLKDDAKQTRTGFAFDQVAHFTSPQKYRKAIRIKYGNFS